MEANGTGQILTDSERWTVNGGTIASRTSTTTRTSTIWKANGGQESERGDRSNSEGSKSERGTGQIAKVQKVKGGQVKSRRFLPFPRRFPNGFAPRSDLMEGWKGGRVEGWKAPSFPRWFYFSGRRSLRCVREKSGLCRSAERANDISTNKAKTVEEFDRRFGQSESILDLAEVTSVSRPKFLGERLRVPCDRPLTILQVEASLRSGDRIP
jgi:hypothetical protein